MGGHRVLVENVISCCGGRTVNVREVEPYTRRWITEAFETQPRETERSVVDEYVFRLKILFCKIVFYNVYLLTYMLLLLYRSDAECRLAVADVTVAHMQAFMQTNCFWEKIREIIAEVLVDEAVGSFSETEEEEGEDYHTCTPTISRCCSTESLQNNLSFKEKIYTVAFNNNF